MTSPDDDRLEGRYPEFATMSRKPGIGYGIVEDIASSLMLSEVDEGLEDVPNTIRSMGQEWPLGRYLKQKLRAQIGRSEKTPQAVLDKMEEELYILWKDAQTAPSGLKQASFKALIQDTFKQARMNLEAKERVRKKREKI
jgi:hypothetical protein